jgi:hypothetical protein
LKRQNLEVIDRAAMLQLKAQNSSMIREFGENSRDIMASAQGKRTSIKEQLTAQVPKNKGLMLAIQQRASMNLRMTERLQSQYQAHNDKIDELEKKIGKNPFDEKKIRQMKDKMQAKGLYESSGESKTALGDIMRETMLGVGLAKANAEGTLGDELRDFDESMTIEVKRNGDMSMVKNESGDVTILPELYRENSYLGTMRLASELRKGTMYENSTYKIGNSARSILA